jgi:uncharacterized cupredoxin-like copper-binding protein
MKRRRLSTRTLILAGAAAVLLAAASAAGVAAAGGAFRDAAVAPSGQCSAPALGGSVVDVSLMNMMNGQMGGGWMTGGSMRLSTSTNHVAAGTVSFRVANMGTLVHELVVLPLPAGQSAGDRVAASNGRVDERGSVGEASNSCASGPGTGLTPGSIGRVTIQLAPGNYELICNLPGHYADGMYAELTVS